MTITVPTIANLTYSVGTGEIKTTIDMPYVFNRDCEYRKTFESYYKDPVTNKEHPLPDYITLD